MVMAIFLMCALRFMGEGLGTKLTIVYNYIMMLRACLCVLDSRSDFELNEDDTITERASPSKDDDSPSTTITAQLLDNFSREEIHFTDDTVDPVLELHIASPPQPLLGSSPSDSLLLPPLSQLLPSPDREGEAEEEMDHMSLMKTEEGITCMEMLYSLTCTDVVQSATRILLSGGAQNLECFCVLKNYLDNFSECRPPCSGV